MSVRITERIEISHGRLPCQPEVFRRVAYRFVHIANKVCLSFVLVAFLLCSTVLVAQELGMKNEQLDAMEFFDDTDYVVRLVTGDMLSGQIKEVEHDNTGTYIRIGAVIGRAKVYAKEIDWIGTTDDAYRVKHRGFVIPTARPIGDDNFIALIEGVMPYIGFGLGNVISVTAGRTLIPGIGWENQLSVINIKATIDESKNGLVEGGKQIYALGVNGTWVNDVNFLGHIYGVATFTGKRTAISTMLFAKVMGKDDYIISGGKFFDPVGFPFASGTIGIALAMDTRFPSMRDLHFIAELWNANITRPSSTALYLGLRLANTSVSMDAGLTLVPGPFVAPMFAFAWTPF